MVGSVPWAPSMILALGCSSSSLDSQDCSLTIWLMSKSFCSSLPGDFLVLNFPDSYCIDLPWLLPALEVRFRGF